MCGENRYIRWVGFYRDMGWKRKANQPKSSNSELEGIVLHHRLTGSERPGHLWEGGGHADLCESLELQRLGEISKGKKKKKPGRTKSNMEKPSRLTHVGSTAHLDRRFVVGLKLAT